VVASLLVLQAVLESKQSLAELVSGMQKLPQVLLNVRLTANNADEILASAAVKQAVIEAETVLADNGRVLLRKSGTEPLIRVMVESTDPEMSQTQAEHIANAVRA
jgi:phosphoglucosamine mutase